MTRKPKIFLTPNGLGLGHIKRLEIIDKALKKKGCTTLYSTYKDALSYCRQSGLPVVEAIPLEYKVKPDGSVDYKATVVFSGLSMGLRRFLSQVMKEVQIMKRFKPDTVLSDSRAAPILAAKILSVPTILLINQLKVYMVRKPSHTIPPQDYVFYAVANLFWIVLSRILEWIWSLSAYILIPDFPNPYTISKANLKIHEKYAYKLKFIGPILDYNPEELGNIDDIKRKHGLKLDRPIVYAAVSGPVTERRILARALESTIPKIKDYQVILTKGEAQARRVDKNPETNNYSWVDEKTHYEFIKACDVVLSRAGHGIITKAMIYGKPLVLIPIPEHTEQRNNAKTCERLGYGVLLEQRNLTLNKIEEALKKALELNPKGLHEVYKKTSLGGWESASNLVYSLTD